MHGQVSVEYTLLVAGAVLIAVLVAANLVTIGSPVVSEVNQKYSRVTLPPSDSMGPIIYVDPLDTTTTVSPGTSITITVTDSSGVAWMWALLDGNQIPGCEKTGPSESLTCTFTPSCPAPPCSYTLTVEANDTVGNKSQKLISFTVASAGSTSSSTSSTPSSSPSSSSSSSSPTTSGSSSGTSGTSSASLPNLYVLTVLVDTSGPVTITPTICNDGAASASNFYVSLTVTDPSGASTTQNSLVTTPVDPGSCIDVNFTYSPPVPLQQGLYDYTVVVDSTNAVTETNEQDNTATGSFYVGLNQPQPVPNPSLP